ncbi:MAG: signal transduction histidine kinase [Nitrospinales bacterium]
MFVLIWDKQKTQWYVGFQNKVQIMNLAVLSKIDLNEKISDSLIALFRSSNFVSREEFRIFTESIIRNQNYIQALEWVPKVPHAKRQEYEEKARSDGLRDFQFSERSKEGEMIRAEIREPYYPAYYVHPMEGNKAALGFDLSSNSTHRKTLIRSLESGRVMSSSRIALVKEDKSGTGFLIFYPHYQGNKVPESLVERRELFVGFIVGIYFIEEMIEDIMQVETARGLNLTIYEGVGVDEKNHLYGTLINDKAMELTFSVNIAGRPWFLVWQAKNFKGGVGLKLPVVASGAVFAVLFLLAMIFEMNLMRTKVVEKEVKQRTIELNRANEDLAQFANIASHDLKAPLRGIGHLTRWIKDDLGENVADEVRDNLGRLEASVKNMDALIQGILEYSRAGDSSSEGKTIKVDTLIHEIMGLIDAGDDVNLEVKPDMPIFTTDSIKLSQVFSNLISNAIKHNSSANKKLVISSERKGGFYEFTVADNGPGISPEYHEKIFQMFQTLEAGDKFENTGVGLSIVKKLVEEANGSIRVNLVEGGGHGLCVFMACSF